MPSSHFADRLCSAIESKDSRVVIGLDPVYSRLPDPLRHAAEAAHPPGPERELGAIEHFCAALISATAEVACAFKPQVAFFEQYGSRGFAVLERLLAAHRGDALFICDCKRGDIGSTSEAYARAYLSLSGAPPAPLDCDAVTHSPYLGRDSIEPYVPYLADKCGMFLLARTSNPGSADFQELLAGDVSLSERVATAASHWAEPLVGERGYSSLGLVVGATYPESAAVLRRLAPRCLFLVPGLETQGGHIADAHHFANRGGQGAIFNFSRAIMHAWERGPVAPEFGPAEYAAAARAAAEHYRRQLNAALGV